MTTRIKVRRDTAQDWYDANPVLALAEPGLETDTRKIKYGDGTTVWRDLLYSSGLTINSDGQITAGNGAGGEGTGTNAIAIGTDAGVNQDYAAIAIGHEAGRTNQNGQAIAIGRSAGYSNQNMNGIAIGRWAGKTDQHEEAIAIGRYAAQTNQGSHGIAIGAEAGVNNQRWNSVAIGRYAGNNSQDSQSIAIGHRAGEDNQEQQSIAIGTYAGNFEQGQHSIAIGAYAGNSGQGWAAIAIGEEAGNYGQDFRAIAIGRWAGDQNQGSQALAVGALAGRTNQGSYSVAIGRHAGHENQGSYAIAIGQEAGQGYIGDFYVSHVSGDGADNTVTVAANTDIRPGMKISNNGYDNMLIVSVDTVSASPNYVLTLANTPNNGSINPGDSFRFTGKQGTNAVAIGAYAARYAQNDNSVVINGTGSELQSAGIGTVVIKTVRAVDASGGVPAGFYPAYYNPTTGELVHLTGL